MKASGRPVKDQAETWAKSSIGDKSLDMERHKPARWGNCSIKC